MRRFVSDPVIYSARPGAGFTGSLWTIPHTLGALPHIVRLEFECLIPEFGYVVGDRVLMNTHAADQLITWNPIFAWAYFSGVATGHVVAKDAINLRVSFDTGQGASFRRWDSTRNGRPSNAAWQWRLKAYAP